MQAYDMQTLGQRLNELAEVFDKKPVGEKGLTVWFNVLREFPTEQVCGVLLGWPKTHSKFPAPSDVWKVVNDIGITKREAKARAESRDDFQPGVGGEQAAKFIESIRKILNNPRWTPREHWKRNLQRFPAGHIGNEYAQIALKMREQPEQPALPDRVPGEDDELIRNAA